MFILVFSPFAMGDAGHTEAFSPDRRKAIQRFIEKARDLGAMPTYEKMNCDCDPESGPKDLPFHESNNSRQGQPLLESSCLSCHSNQENGFNIEKWMDDKQEWDRRLASSDKVQKTQAITALGRLYSTLVANKNMPPLSETVARSQFNANSNHDDFVAFIKDRFETLHPLKNLTQDLSVAPNRVSVMDSQLEAKYRSLFPKTESPQLEAILKDPNLLLMDKTHMVAGYQDPSNPVLGERSTEPGFKGAGFANDTPFIDKSGHLKLWSFGFGLENSPNAKSFHFLRLPKDETGALKKIKVTSRGTGQPDGGTLYDWEFPVGTISGEVILGTDSQGKQHVLQMRLRTKDQAQGPWAADVFKPYPTIDTLRGKLDQISRSNGPLANEAEKLMNELKKPNRLKAISLGMHGYQKGELDSKGGTEQLPEMSEALSLALLDEPFKSSLGTEWDKDDKVTAFAPTSQQPFSIVTQNNNEGAVRVGRSTCNLCHKNSNTPFRDFYDKTHPKYYSSIVAYANTPGSDQQLRFNIFDQEEFKRFGNQGVKDNRKINPKLKPILDIK